MTWLAIALLVLAAYALGAIPAGWLVGRAMRRDLLRAGSGKTGTANTLSVLGRPAAVLVFVLDLAKGAGGALLPALFTWPDPTWRALALGAAGTAAIAGHNWSLWLRLLAGQWSSGRGLVPALGATLVVHPLVSVLALAGITLGLALSRYVVVAAVLAVLAAWGEAALLAVLGTISPWLLPGVGAWGLVVLAAFADSFRRLARGQETRVG